MSSFGFLELSGTERDSKTGRTLEVREVTRRLDKTDTIFGVPVVVLEVKFHCPRVGTVRAEGPDGTAELVRFS